MIEDVTHDSKEEFATKIKEIENSILKKINAYNDNLQDYTEKYNAFRESESRGFVVSQKLISAIKSKRDTSSLEFALNDIINEVDGAKTDAMEVQKTTLVSLQSLHKEHIEYLTNIISGLKIQCEKLEKGLPVKADTRSENIYID